MFCKSSICSDYPCICTVTWNSNNNAAFIRCTYRLIQYFFSVIYNLISFAYDLMSESLQDQVTKQITETKKIKLLLIIFIKDGRGIYGFKFKCQPLSLMKNRPLAYQINIGILNKFFLLFLPLSPCQI